MKKTNWDRVNKVLLTAEWPAMNERTDLNAAAETWTHIVKNAVHAYTPTKDITIRPDDKRWITPDIKNRIKRRNKEYTLAKRSGLPRNHRIWNKWKELENK